MRSSLEYLLKEIEWNSSGISDVELDKIKIKIGFELPEDYLEVMREHNGGEGEVGENGWLCLFDLDKLPEINSDYILLMAKIPEYYLFGKDAADTGFAFHKVNKTIHSFGLMSNFKTDPIEFCGNNFEAFAQYLYDL